MWSSPARRRIRKVYGEGSPVQTQFERFNVHVYYTVISVFLDFVIWCLGPLVDDERDYGLPRLYLAAVTRRLCRRILLRRGLITEAD